MLSRFLRSGLMNRKPSLGRPRFPPLPVPRPPVLSQQLSSLLICLSIHGLPIHNAKRKVCWSGRGIYPTFADPMRRLFD